jgi:lysophospholipase L1-like esterase
VHVVVLGSSTAEGVGASVPESSWVNRYRAALKALNPDHQVTNLALGGYTTWHVRPTGSPHPADRPAPDPARNVTQALSLGADAIILNLPTNDIANGWPIWEQITNDDLVRSVAANSSVPVWVATSQPRNFAGSMLDSLKKLRDTTFVHYGRYAIDFWTDLATASGTIVPQYDSGDGIHLNDAGHRILFQRVLAEDIHKIFLVGVADTPVAVLESIMSVSPQPIQRTATVHFLVANPGDAVLQVYDLHGRSVARVDCGFRAPGAHQVPLDASGLPDGLYFCQLRVGKEPATGLVRLAIVH